MTHPAELIGIKREGGAWSTGQIDEIIRGVVDGSLADVQLGALLMAVCLRGATIAETSALTLAMRDSGRVLDLSSIRGRKIDKHSTGGVGDKVSLLLAPLVAACGVAVPMISGRGLGHTGGTLDKLESIPGYRTALEPDEFVAIVGEVGFAMAGASADVAPADRRMYAARDVSGTVASVPWITSSILSKKLAEGIDGLVLDVKCGRAAFLPDREDAEALMRSLVATGSAAGLDVVALLTDMDAPLGRAVGNAVEVAEVVDCLHGGGPADLLEVTMALGAEMLVLAGVARDLGAARSQLAAALATGAARERLVRNVERQGGDPRFIDDRGRLPTAPVQRLIRAPRAGHVVDIDPLAAGRLAMELGAGRRSPGASIDPRVGVVMLAALGDAVAAGDPLAELHAADDPTADRVEGRFAGCVRIDDSAPPRRRLILDRLAAGSRR